MHTLDASSEAVPGATPLGPRSVVSVLRELMTERARGWRVVTLLIAIAAMSIGDLLMTLTFARSIGMVELNPMARFLMQAPSPAYIIVYKMSSVLIACAILFMARKTRVGELGSWLAFFGLLWLTIRWLEYSEAMVIITGHLHYFANVEQSNWVEMPGN